MKGKMLSSIQSKYDFAPKENQPGTVSGISGPGSPTTACDNVCRALLEVANTVRAHEVKSENQENIIFCKILIPSIKYRNDSNYCNDCTDDHKYYQY